MRKRHNWAALAALLLVALLAGPGGLPAAHAANLVVNSATDGTPTDDWLCTLREAIMEANRLSGPAVYDECGSANMPGKDAITFGIGTGAQTITLVDSGLPKIVDSLTIDGTTQPVYAGVPLITIDGLPSSDIFSVGAADVTIKGLMLVGANGTSTSAINVGVDASNVTIQSNYIGTNGTSAIPNAYGISISGSNNNLIGGTGPNQGNLISGNLQNGIYIYTWAANNVIQGNKIGTNAAGTDDVPNLYGINMASAGVNTVGGETAGAGNLISGNSQDGINVMGGTGGSVIKGNKIGATADGNSALPNNNGVKLTSTGAATIGGEAAGAGNLISGNRQHGIFVENGTGGVVIEGNKIGTNAAGTLALPNVDGIRLGSAGANTVGGETAGAGNLISGNQQHGIYAYGSMGGTVIKGNTIGATADGGSALPNDTGISMSGTGVVTIGGESAEAGNVISGNDVLGIILYAASPGTLIQGNKIGTTADGLSALSNSEGLRLTSGSGVTIGGTTPGAGNLISGNANPAHFGFGIYFDYDGSAPTDVVIQGNKIGTNITGTAAIPNGTGLSLQGSSHTVGGLAAGAGNLISGNYGNGLYTTQADDLMVEGNTIGATADGTGVLPNGGVGIYLSAGTTSTVTLTANRIAHHADTGKLGIYMDNPVAIGTGSINNCIAGNYGGVFRAYPGPTIDFPGNWWGAIDGPSGNGSGSGDSIDGAITASAWLDTAPAACLPGAGLPVTSHDFGAVVVGATSAPYVFSVKNTGLSPLQISGSLSVSPEFGLSGDTCSSSTILPGDTCSFGVSYIPAVAGARTGSVTIAHNAAGSPHSISLSGIGLTTRTPPVLKSPKDGKVIYKPPKLGWKAVKKPLAGYHVEIMDSGGIAVQTGDPVKNKFLTTLLPFGVYTWHVAVRDSGGQSAYSAPFSFEYTLNKSPKKGVTLKNGVVKFRWQGIKGATYELEVYTLSPDPTPVKTVVLNPTGLKKASYPVDKHTPLPGGTTYYWRVSIDGGTTWTLPWSFNVP